MKDSQISLPSKLYRFRSLENLGRTLKEISCLHWFSIAENLNDPFDGISGLSSEKVDEQKLIKYKLKKNGKSGNLLVSVKGEKKWMVCCFSEKWDSVPMWAHYALNGAGVCLEYDHKIINDRIKEAVKEPILEIDRSLALNAVEYVEKLPQTIDETDKGIFLKAKSWEYEKEWRVALLALEREDRKGGIMVNLHGAVTRVIIGWKVSDEAYTPVIDVINKLRAGGENINLGIVRVDKCSRNFYIESPRGKQLVKVSSGKR